MSTSPASRLKPHLTLDIESRRQSLSRRPSSTWAISLPNQRAPTSSVQQLSSLVHPRVSIPITHHGLPIAVSRSLFFNATLVANVDRARRSCLIGYHEYSFAYATMGKRLPTILGKAIDDVIRTMNEQVCVFTGFTVSGTVPVTLLNEPFFFSPV